MPTIPSFLSRRGVTRKVLDAELTFFPLSMTTSLLFRSALKDLFKAIATFFFDDSSAARTVNKTQIIGEGKEPGTKTETSFQAIDPRLAEQRHLFRQAAIDSIVDTMLHPGNSLLYSTVIHDSLRVPSNEWPRTEDEARAYLNGVSADAFFELVMGVVEANKSVIDPLVQRLLSAREQLASAQQPLDPTQNKTPEAKSSGS